MLDLEGQSIIDKARMDSTFATDSKAPLERFAQRFWIWFIDNQNEKIASILWYSVRLKDLRKIFEKIFGPMPQVV